MPSEWHLSHSVAANATVPLWHAPHHFPSNISPIFMSFAPLFILKPRSRWHTLQTNWVLCNQWGNTTERMGCPSPVYLFIITLPYSWGGIMLCMPAAFPFTSISAADFGGADLGFAPIPVIKGKDRNNMSTMGNLLNIRPPQWHLKGFLAARYYQQVH